LDIFEKAENGVVKTGLPSGFNEYDLLTNGHGKGELIIVAARPSVGKTAFALNMAGGHMDNGAFGHLYSLEMDDETFLNRMIQARGRINSEKMRNPKQRFSSDEWDR
ncbi:DnaB-like helicase C-terminal domain-containing protein, partial [Pseudomonas sp. 2822-17]|uniref:DnaB-like helicase C-terminal domain-containing protein n=1 Tax=Pseudomonas sp. 2822-17 TaxID=1712678 RepID=UPI001C441FDD